MRKHTQTAITCLVLLGFVCYLGNSGNRKSVENQTNATTITLAQYSRVTAGMTYNDVCAILGDPGVQKSSSSSENYSHSIYKWGSATAYCIILFEDGLSTDISQFGLE